MPYIKYLMLFTILFTSFSIQSQEIDKKTRVVKIFTPEEKDNLQVWFHDEIKKMEFSEEELDEYYGVIFYYIAKIARLDDKDQDFTEEEFKKELNIYLAKQDADLQEILSPKQFELHTEIYGNFIKSAYKRWGFSE